ncbi:cytochrome f-like [Tripterygium wilfordii]|uniref:cytochrome f-like n=1 Tax=Tripterygium wilfordii TaxID=458696 RepID=UPI0018F82DFD|nr:cytochrome f-like [Tripterygium wilfordii]
MTWASISNAYPIFAQQGYENPRETTCRSQYSLYSSYQYHHSYESQDKPISQRSRLGKVATSIVFPCQLLVWRTSKHIQRNLGDAIKQKENAPDRETIAPPSKVGSMVRPAVYRKKERVYRTKKITAIDFDQPN